MQVGDRYGRLVVVAEVEPRITPGGHRIRRIHCQCDCGNTRTVNKTHLANGATQSCGCLRNERVRKACVTHGEKPKHGNASPEHRAWAAMKSRCTNPNTRGYENYGGRGINVCDRWLNSYEDFLADMGRRPSPNHSIDREDVDGDYTPENCRWATPHQQSQNRRNIIKVQLDGETICLKEACRRTGVPYKAAVQRRNRGWSQERWLEPVR